MRRFILLKILICLTFVYSVFSAESRLELKTHYSPALGIEKNYYIYLPEGYNENPDERYPVVYFFRGHESEWTDPAEDFSRQNRNIKTLADQLYQQGSIGRMILVMPGTMIRENGFITDGLNLNFPQFVDDTVGLGTGQYEDYLIEDLVLHIDTTYRTIASGTHRGTDGFSAGGWPALTYATKYPDMFSSVGAFDGYMTHYLDLDNPNWPGPLDHWIYWYEGNDPWYGPVPRDAQEIMQDSPANLIYDADDYNMSGLHRMQFLLHTVTPDNDIGIRWMTPYINDILNLRGLKNYFGEGQFSASAAHTWYYADEHALVTLPLHWQKFQNPIDLLEMSLPEPSANTEISGDVLVQWSPGRAMQSAETDIFYSRDGGARETRIASLASLDSTYLWSTSEVPDGTQYKLRVFTRGTDLANEDSVLGIARTQGLFTINNPGNAVPEIAISIPEGGQQISGTLQITWQAADADGETLTYAVEYSADDGQTWKQLADSLTDTFYNWNTILYENSYNVRVAVHARDTESQASDTSEVFGVYNPRLPANDKRITQISGSGTPEIEIFIVEPEQVVPDAMYRITFDDTIYTNTVFYVINYATGDTLIHAGDQLNGQRESDLFDGIRLGITDYAMPEVNNAGTGWQNSASNLNLKVYLPEVNIGGEIKRGIAYAADYRITVADQVADSSTNAFNIPAKAVYFKVENISENRAADFIFQDANRDQKIGDNDILYLLEKNAQHEFELIWAITFTGPQNPIEPESGDVALLATFKPVTAEDVFEFEVVNDIADRRIDLPLSFALDQNYPNPFNPSTIISWQLATASPVKLEVFTVLGEKVATLVDRVQGAGKYHIEWNARQLASGVYYYRLKAGTFEQVKKMVLLR